MLEVNATTTKQLHDQLCLYKRKMEELISITDVPRNLYFQRGYHLGSREYLEKETEGRTLINILTKPIQDLHTSVTQARHSLKRPPPAPLMQQLIRDTEYEGLRMAKAAGLGGMINEVKCSLTGAPSIGGVVNRNTSRTLSKRTLILSPAWHRTVHAKGLSIVEGKLVTHARLHAVEDDIAFYKASWVERHNNTVVIRYGGIAVALWADDMVLQASSSKAVLKDALIARMSDRVLACLAG